MIYTVMPLGVAHGWGICGRYLTRELARIDRLRLLTERVEPDLVADELELLELRALVPPAAEASQLESAGYRVECPVLQCVQGNRALEPAMPRLRGTRNVGYAFFEENVLRPEAVAAARQAFDVLACGSTWCADVLRRNGMDNVATVLQGVDPAAFHPAEREFLADRFVVFSGGKLELRKGQDLVIRAYKVLQDRHQDVLLVNQWYNPWDATVQTMAASPYIRFAPTSTDHVTRINQVLADNGVDLARVLTLTPRSNFLMARAYWNSDVGLFPNRCEGGTNLVLMEYMACGRPAVATFGSGHRDILTDHNALPVRNLRELTVNSDQGPLAVWDAPDLDEIVEKLEWAYQHRTDLAALGAQAARDMAKLTWRRSAAGLYELLTG